MGYIGKGNGVSLPVPFAYIILEGKMRTDNWGREREAAIRRHKPLNPYG